MALNNPASNLTKIYYTYTLHVLLQIFTGPRFMFTQGTSKSQISIPNFNAEFHARETSVNSSSDMNFCRIRNSFKEQQVRKENLDDLNFFVFQVSTSTKLEHEEELDLTDEPKDQKQILVLELKTKNKKAVK